MRGRFPAVLITVVLIASACTAATPSVAPGSASAPASVAPSASAAPTEDVKTTLRVARISDFLPSIHPVDLGTGNQELMADIVFSTLVDVDSDEVTILPDLATEWTASPDATVYTFKLNPAAVWSDGKPVTADDVEFTIAWSAQNPTAFKQIPVDMWIERQGRRRRRRHDEHPRGHQEDRRAHRRDHAREPRTPRSCGGSPAPSTTSFRSTCSTDLTAEAGAHLRLLPRHRRRDDRLRAVRLLRVDLGRRRELHRKKDYWKGKDSQIDELVYKIQESNVSVAQLAAGELDLVIRVPPAEGPGLADVAGPQAAERARASASSPSTSTTPTPTRPSARRSPTRSTGRRSSSRCSVAWRRSTTRSRPASRSTTTSTSTSST